MIDFLRRGALNVDTLYKKYPDQVRLDKHFDNILSTVRSLESPSLISNVEWPPGVPDPEDLNGRPETDDEAAAYDIICIATAYVFLHEARHEQIAADPAIKSAYPSHIDEEVECDRYARSMILDKIEEYADEYGESAPLLRQKRVLGIPIAKLLIFTLTENITKYGTGTHPSLKERLDPVISNVGEVGRLFWPTAAAMMLAFARNAGLISKAYQFESWEELTKDFVEDLCK